VKNLLVYAYSANSHSQVFSHQLPAIERIANKFQEVIVVVPREKKINVAEISNSLMTSKNITIVEFPWSQGRPFKNVINLIRVTELLFKAKHIHTVFYFMTESYAAVLGPILKLKKVQQLLWYAHTSKPLHLILLKPFMNLICSSTSGSIPLKGKKVRLIGQMVDETIFTKNDYDYRYRYRLIHVGRLDPSKQIETLIKATLELQEIFPKIELYLYGSPTNDLGKQYISTLKAKYSKEIEMGLIKIMQPVKRDQLSSLYKNMGIFVHAFQGSLDKTVVEATLSGLPVASLNQEYTKEFGNWASRPKSLAAEITSIYELSQRCLKYQISKRRNLALKNHSLSQWARQIEELLNG
jgi:glycosyltransferase involved in cell wall biosynthesis